MSEMNSSTKEPNIVYVGRKPPMNYVLGIITSFSGSNIEEVTLKARGQAITTAIDAVEIARRKFLKNLNVKNIAIGTEEMPPRQGESRSRMISTIDITLTQNQIREKTETKTGTAKKKK